jgi:hypothetical protein
MLTFVMVRGGVPTPGSLISVLGTFGLYGVVILAIWDARVRRHQRSQE